MAAKIKKGDKVVVLAGRDKGKAGEAIRIIECAPKSKTKTWEVLPKGGADQKQA